MRQQSLLIVASFLVVSCSGGPDAKPKDVKKGDAEGKKGDVRSIDPKEAIVGEWESVNKGANDSIRRFTADGRFDGHIKAVPAASLGGKYRFLDDRTIEYDWDPPTEGGQRRIDKRVVVFKDRNFFSEAPIDSPDSPQAVLFCRVGVKPSPEAADIIAASKSRAEKQAKDRFALITKVPDDTDAKELAKLQGTWQCISLHNGSDKMPDEIAERRRISIKGNEYQEGKTEGMLKLDTTQKPFRIDFVFRGADGDTRARKGIFEFVDNDTLTVARTPANPSDPRPTELKTKFDVSLEVYKRGTTKNEP